MSEAEFKLAAESATETDITDTEIETINRFLRTDPDFLAAVRQAVKETDPEEKLKALMRDPRYWKHQDLAIVEQVREGFRRLYQSGPG